MNHSTAVYATVELEWTPYPYCDEEFTANVIFDGNKLVEIISMSEVGSGLTHYFVTEDDVWQECADIVASHKKGFIDGYLVADNGEE